MLTLTNNSLFNSVKEKKLKLKKTECEDRRVAGLPVPSPQDETLTQVFLTHLVGVFKTKLPKIH